MNNNNSENNSSNKSCLKIKKACALGDSIHQPKVNNLYTCLVDRNIGEYVRDYELSLKDIEGLYADIASRMAEVGFKASNTHSCLAQNIACPKNVYNAMRDSDKRDFTVKVLLKRVADYDYVSVDTQIGKIVTVLQNMLVVEYGDIRYLNLVSKKLRGSLDGMCNSMYLKQYFSGYVVQDLLCTRVHMDFSTADIDRIVKLLNANLAVFNNALESCEVVRFYTSRGFNNNVMPSDYNLLLGEVNRTVFPDLVERYTAWANSADMNILVGDTRASIRLMVKEVGVKKEWVNLYIAQKNDKWVVGCYTRGNINPYLLLKKLYNKVKLTEIYHNASFGVYGLYKNIMYNKNLCACGKEIPYNSILASSDGLCPECLVKKLMAVHIRRK